MCGSQSLEVDLPVATELKVIIFLYKSNSGLFKNRTFKQSFLIFISGILGSVFGIMGTIEGLMIFFENKHQSILDKCNRQKSVHDIKLERKIIHYLNFGEGNQELTDIEPE